MSTTPDPERCRHCMTVLRKQTPESLVLRAQGIFYMICDGCDGHDPAGYGLDVRDAKAQNMAFTEHGYMPMADMDAAVQRSAEARAMSWEDRVRVWEAAARESGVDMDKTILGVLEANVARLARETREEQEASGVEAADPEALRELEGKATPEEQDELAAGFKEHPRVLNPEECEHDGGVDYLSPGQVACSLCGEPLEQPEHPDPVVSVRHYPKPTWRERVRALWERQKRIGTRP